MYTSFIPRAIDHISQLDIDGAVGTDANKQLATVLSERVVQCMYEHTNRPTHTVMRDHCFALVEWIACQNEPVTCLGLKMRSILDDSTPHKHMLQLLDEAQSLNEQEVCLRAVLISASGEVTEICIYESELTLQNYDTLALEVGRPKSYMSLWFQPESIAENRKATQLTQRAQSEECVTKIKIRGSVLLTDAKKDGENCNFTKQKYTAWCKIVNKFSLSKRRTLHAQRKTDLIKSFRTGRQMTTYMSSDVRKRQLTVLHYYKIVRERMQERGQNYRHSSPLDSQACIDWATTKHVLFVHAATVHVSDLKLTLAAVDKAKLPMRIARNVIHDIIGLTASFQCICAVFEWFGTDTLLQIVDHDDLLKHAVYLQKSNAFLCQLIVLGVKPSQFVCEEARGLGYDIVYRILKYAFDRVQ